MDRYGVVLTAKNPRPDRQLARPALLKLSFAGVGRLTSQLQPLARQC